MDDPAKVMIVISGCIAAAYSVKVIASAALQYQLNELKNPNRTVASSEDRLARIEQAVDAIAVEVERISEGQRFTTKLLSERTEKR
jgi:hypothetical protein